MIETLTYLGHGFAVATSPANLIAAFIGAAIGTMAGLLPGLGPTNGVALLIPLIFALGLPSDTALVLMTAVYIGCEYGGRISSILINVPGDAAAIATAWDGYPMAQKGRAGVALSISAWSSFVGSIIATIGLCLIAPALADWAVAFGPAEYFALIIFSFVCIGCLISDQPAKATLAVAIGMLLGTVGIDPGTGVYRFTFGMVNIYDGIPFISLVIGLFAISESLLIIERVHFKSAERIFDKQKLFGLADLKRTTGTTLRSSAIGFFVGVLPGAGATIASTVAYTIAKRLAGAQGEFGKGDIRGVAAPEAANNASAGGSFVPMLTLGIPGSSTTAIMMGVLTLYHINPGPLLFTNEPQLVWGLFASMFLTNAILLLMNVSLVSVFASVLKLPYWVLVPFILIIGFAGSYSINSSVFDLVLTALVGIFGYILRKRGVPLAPLVLAFILGKMLEQNMRRALAISDGDFSIFIGSDISITLWIATALMLAIPAGVAIRRWRSSVEPVRATAPDDA